MRRATFCSLAVLGFLAVGLAAADDTKNKNHEKATIDKVDSAKGTVTVTVKGPDGKEAEKTIHMGNGVECLDAHGKAAKIDAFQTGDCVVITEKDGKITELKKDKEHTKATITKVDAKKGMVSVKMKDKEGKDTEKTFYLTEDAEYFDSTGKVAVIDVFQSGDEVLIVESDGKIKELVKDAKGHSGEKDKTNGDKKPNQK